MKKQIALILTSLFLTLIVRGESPSVVGHWEIEITFPQRVRTCRFEASANGKGVFSARTPEQKTNRGPRDDLTAEWSGTKGGSITFVGPIAFPLGNVGLERGRLILRGHFTRADTLAGEAGFAPTAQDPSSPSAQPAKTGTFTATRNPH